jgi:hypothetical protein
MVEAASNPVADHFVSVLVTFVLSIINWWATSYSPRVPWPASKTFRRDGPLLQRAQLPWIHRALNCWSCTVSDCRS